MGKSDGNHDLFWQLFVSHSGARWSLVTPPGVADNGGLVVAQGENDTLLVGIGASQGLSVSPLAESVNGGVGWTPGGLAQRLLGVPAALALGPDGHAVALVSGADQEVVTRMGSLTTWHLVVTRRQLASLSASKSCGIQDLEAVGFDLIGETLIGTRCANQGASAIFVNSASGWQPVHISGHLPGEVSVLRLSTTVGVAAALLLEVQPGTTSIGAAWQRHGTPTWRISAPLALGARDRIVASGLGSTGSQFVVVQTPTGLRAEVISKPNGAWRVISNLPPRTATLALGPDGVVAALSVNDTNLTVWTHAAATGGWKRAQTISVPIAFGSSA